MEKNIDREDQKKTKPGEWSETCIGYWSRSTYHTRNNKITQNIPICNGINIVRIKNLDINSVPRSDTNGFEVLIQEREVPQEMQKVQESNAGFELIYNTYQKKLLAMQGYWSRLKYCSEVVTNYAKDIHNCPNKLERVNSIISEEYHHLKDWYRNSWK